jgi:hypothetical protein
MYQSKKELAKRVAKTALLVGVAASPMAFAAGEVEAGITEAQTTILTYIGLAIAAGFALLTASLAPDVGMTLVKKWIKKGAK